MWPAAFARAILGSALPCFIKTKSIFNSCDSFPSSHLRHLKPSSLKPGSPNCFASKASARLTKIRWPATSEIGSKQRHQLFPGKLKMRPAFDGIVWVWSSSHGLLTWKNSYSKKLTAAHEAGSGCFQTYGSTWLYMALHGSTWLYPVRFSIA